MNATARGQQTLTFHQYWSKQFELPAHDIPYNFFLQSPRGHRILLTPTRGSGKRPERWDAPL